VIQAPSDQALVMRIAEGDRLAMQALYVRHHLRTYRFVMRLVRDPHVAEDIVSEVFLAVWRHADRFQARSAVSTWILAMARFKALSSLKRRTDKHLDDATAAIEDPGDDPQVAIEKKDKAKILRNCLSRLSRDHREIIDLVYYQEATIRDAAEIVGIPENTVKTRMFHARKRLSALLAAAGVHASAS
jgi:RNA polymerase sigma-70 factor (ECF subfamily)